MVQRENGCELSIFSRALRWKAYWSHHVKPFLGARVLEVGAGIGGTTEAICTGDSEDWLCLEPDPRLAEELAAKLGRMLPACCRLRVGTVQQLDVDEHFDSAMYIDVLEHIEDDRSELTAAGEHLEPGGHLIVLVPAHQFLFTPFDTAVGHFRRYSRRSLHELSPSGFQCLVCRYLDSAGMLASLANRLLLRSSMPTRAQIEFWDSCLVPCSRMADPLLRYSLGKSALCVWRKD